MTARDEVLGAVRRALAAAPREPVQVPRGYGDQAAPGDPIALFAERVADYGAVVERCSHKEIRERIAAALLGAGRVLVPRGMSWTMPGATAGDGLSAEELDDFDAVLTGATLGIAETGTIVLTHGPEEGRRALSLVPDLHVCVVRAEDVVPHVPAAIAALDPTRPQTWISGPSATSDIELARVEGVHGPRRLHVIVTSPTSLT